MTEETISTIEQWLDEKKMPHAILEAMQDAGYEYDDPEEAIEWIDNGDYTMIYALDGSDETLGQNAVDEFGFPSEPERYIDEEYLRSDLELEEMQEDDESDEDYEARIDELLQMVLDDMPEEQMETYFDYAAWGRDLRIGDGYCYYSDDGIWIATY